MGSEMCIRDRHRDRTTKERETAHGAGQRCSRSTSRSTGGGGRSTGLVDRRARACTGKSGRPAPVDRLKWPLLSGRRGRPGRSTVAWVDRLVNRQARLKFPFRIRILFLVGIESNLGFYKSRDSVAINRGYCIIFHIHIMLYVNKNKLFTPFLSKFAPPLMERKAHNLWNYQGINGIN